MEGRDGQLRLRSGRSSEQAPLQEAELGGSGVTEMPGAGAESERSIFFRSANSSIFSFTRSIKSENNLRHLWFIIVITGHFRFQQRPSQDIFFPWPVLSSCPVTQVALLGRPVRPCTVKKCPTPSLNCRTGQDVLQGGHRFSLTCLMVKSHTKIDLFLANKFVSHSFICKYAILSFIKEWPSSKTSFRRNSKKQIERKQKKYRENVTPVSVSIVLKRYYPVAED